MIAPIDARPADIAAARRLGPTPAMKRDARSGKLTYVLPTAAQDRIVRRWVAEHARDTFMIGNIVLTADARSYLHDLADKLARVEAAVEI